jgi:hypothetical protein
MRKKPKNKVAQALVRARWGKASEAEKKAAGEMLTRARKNKERARTRAAVKRALARASAA